METALVGMPAECCLPRQQNVIGPDLAQVLFIIWRRSAKRVWAGLFLSNGPMPEQVGITDQEQIWARTGPVQLLLP